MPHARLALLGLMLSTLGCVDAQHAAKLQQEITQLRAELTSTNKELTELQQQVSFDRALAEATAKTTAYFTPGLTGFHLCRQNSDDNREPRKRRGLRERLSCNALIRQSYVRNFDRGEGDRGVGNG